MVQRIIALLLFILLLPLFFILYIFVLLSSKGPFLFKQKRMGKNKEIFTLYKIRSMVENAELLKKNILYLNEAHGPVFKIKNDPRYTRIGKLLSRTGLDELPQLINILQGQMAFVGPRPLPIEEAKKIPTQYHERFNVLPGITSSWVIKGAHALTFQEWMKLDLEYIHKKSLWHDIYIAFMTLKVISTSLIKYFSYSKN